jgi:phage shock protein PspC (stress-responsive transcriptional regulator)
MGLSDDLSQLREGSMLDYDMQTWEVSDYESHSDAGWPADEWTLKSGTDVLFLEHEYDDGDVFRLSAPAKISEITVEDYHGQQGEPFLTAIREEDAPATILYRGDEYVLAEEDARVDAGQTVAEGELVRSEHDSMIMGVCGGFGEYMGVPSTILRLVVVGAFLLSNGVIPCFGMPVVLGVYFLLGASMPRAASSSNESGLTHYWVYQKGDEFVALECHGTNDWGAYAGREVEPYEFDNLLPGKSAG